MAIWIKDHQLIYGRDNPYKCLDCGCPLFFQHYMRRGQRRTCVPCFSEQFDVDQVVPRNRKRMQVDFKDCRVDVPMSGWSLREVPTRVCNSCEISLPPGSQYYHNFLPASSTAPSCLITICVECYVDKQPVGNWDSITVDQLRELFGY